MGKLVSLLKETDLFYNLSQTQLELVESLCEEIMVPAGKLVFPENSNENELYIILDGAVDIVINPMLVSVDQKNPVEPQLIATLFRGQSFGEIALVDEGVRTASARSSDDSTRLLRIPRQQFLLLCNTYPELGYRVFFNLASDLAQKIRNADLKLREVMLYAKPSNGPTK